MMQEPFERDGVPSPESAQTGRKAAEQPDNFSVFIYTGILHRFGIGSNEAQEFRQSLNQDPLFQRRADVLEKLVALESAEDRIPEMRT